jgi:hypothetical protein
MSAPQSRFVIYSLPRCGSTAMANLLNCHPGIRCLIEPFYEARYEGRFHKLAVNFSIDFALEMIWDRWNGIKHVWLPGGGPFEGKPEYNERILLGPKRKLIVMLRRNLLRRAVSNLVCTQTGYWIGTRAEFQQRLASTVLRPLDSVALREWIARDFEASNSLLNQLRAHRADYRVVYYEDLFDQQRDRAGQLVLMNDLLDFLQFRPITEEEFAGQWQQLLNPEENRWASADVYEILPGARQVDEAIGCEETGWLFR